MEDLSLRNYAHIGDAVWELFVREFTVNKTQNSKLLHKITTERVRASFQAELLSFIENDLSDSEKEIVRRARNIAVPIARRNNQAEYRMATAFECIIGYWYLNDKIRLEFFFNKIKQTEYFI